MILFKWILYEDHMFKKLALFSLILLLAGCIATGSALVTGERRAPIELEQVKIFHKEPDFEYEHIGIVKSESVEIASQQKAVDRALEELKKQAAKIGANGVILHSVGEKQKNYAGYNVISSGGGYFYSDSEEYQTLAGDAIYIDQSKK
tara:strand:+ start:460 stop:903 length:444 start_codon:yes stop_codon:yes gene_type:complete